MRQIYICLGILLPALICAQIPSYQWAGTYGNSYSQDPYSVASDANDNMYVGGAFFQGNFDLDPGPANNYVSANTSSDAFLIKLNSAGVFQWGFDIGVIFGDIIYDVDCTPSGTVVAVGSYAGNYVYADPGVNGYPFPPGASNGAEAFAACYDANGNYLWQYTLNAPGAQYFHDVAIDDNGYVYISCEFVNTVVVDQSTSASFTSVNGSQDMLIIKLSPSGTYINAWQIGGTYTQQPIALDVDNRGHVILTGYTTSVVDFDPGVNTFNLSTPLSQTDAFVASYDTNGIFNWAFLLVTGTSIWGEHVSCDANGNIFLIGSLEDTVDFDPGIGTSVLFADTYGDGYLTSYDSSGAFRFAFLLGTDLNIDRIEDISVDAANNFYLGGRFSGVCDFDPGVGVDTIRTNMNGQTTAAFIAKYSNTGQYQWAFHFQPTTSLGTDARVDCIDVNSNGNIFVSGYVGNDCDFDPIGTAIVSGNNRLTYVAKYGGACVAPSTPAAISGASVICENSSNTYSIAPVAGAATYNWTLPAGWTGNSTTNTITPTASATGGVIAVTASNNCGTSAAATYSVTVNPLPVVTYSQNPDTFCIPGPVQTLSPGSPTGGTYFGPAVTGNTIDPSQLPIDTFYIYYTFTDSNGCSAYDSAFIVADICNTITAVDHQSIEVYPSPFTELLTFSNLPGEEVTVEIFSSLGEVVDRFSFAGAVYVRNTANLATGIYFVRMNSKNGTQVETIIK